MILDETKRVVKVLERAADRKNETNGTNMENE